VARLRWQVGRRDWELKLRKQVGRGGGAGPGAAPARWSCAARWRADCALRAARKERRGAAADGGADAPGPARQPGHAPPRAAGVLRGAATRSRDGFLSYRILSRVRWVFRSVDTECLRQLTARARVQADAARKEFAEVNAGLLQAPALILSVSYLILSFNLIYPPGPLASFILTERRLLDCGHVT